MRRHARRHLSKLPWLIAAVLSCGGKTTEAAGGADGGPSQAPSAPTDSSGGGGGGGDSTACDRSSCSYPTCPPGSAAVLSSDSCCPECESDLCPSLDYGFNCGAQIATVNSCDFALAQFPPNPWDITVAVNCELAERARYSDGGTVRVSGDWEVDPGTIPATIRIYGPLCDSLTREGAQRIDVLYGCPIGF